MIIRIFKDFSATLHHGINTYNINQLKHERGRRIQMSEQFSSGTKIHYKQNITEVY